MIEVKIDDAQIIKALQKLQAVTGDLSPALKEIGEVLTESTKERFNTGTDPDGQPWADNSNVTVERKGRNKPLLDSDTLMESIRPNVIGNNILEIGTSIEYAAMQQFGGEKSEFSHLWGNIPARPFLGISADDERQILIILEAHLKP